jgi:hypothetical protein
MPDYLQIAMGLVLIVAGFMASGVSYGMPPHRLKPKYQVTWKVRRVLFAAGLLSLMSGLASMF